jgi:FkbM family methyltransferase
MLRGDRGTARRLIRALARGLVKLLVHQALIGRGLERWGLYLGRNYDASTLTRRYVYYVAEALATAPWSGPKRIAHARCGISLTLSLVEHYGRHLYFYGTYDEPTTRLFQRLLRPGDIVLDVGAQIGYFSALAAKLVGASGAVYAFEAEPRTVRWLTRNLELNGVADRVAVVPLAVADVDHEVRLLYTSEGDTATGLSSLVQQHDWGAYDRRVPVRTITIDSYLAERSIPRVDIVKVDVESAEWLVLNGMKATLRNTRPRAVILELTADGLVPIANIVAFMASFGYVGKMLDPRGLLDLDGDSVSYCNAVFFPHQQVPGPAD